MVDAVLKRTVAFAMKWAYGVRWFGEQRKGRSMPPQLLWIGYCTLVSSLLATTCFAIPDHGPTRDADHGRTLVNRWCVGCHLVGTDQKQATTDAPPFATIAKKPDFDAAKLAFFLLNPHPKMPDMQLSRDETSDIAAYIATLR
jgi:mono/diheme cytochrome c family protein